MFSENEYSIMTATRICSDRSSYWHSSVSFLRLKKSHSVRSLHWLHIQLLVVLFVAGQTSCQTPATTVTSANVQTQVNYFFDVSVNVNVEKDESEVIAWLKEVFQNNLQSCVSSTTVDSATEQTTTATSTSSRPTTTSTSTSTSAMQDITTTTPSTSTAAKTTTTTSSSATSTPATSTATTSTPSTSTAAKTTTTSTPATSTATTSTPSTSTAAKTTTTTSTSATSTPAKSTATTSTPSTSTAAKTTTTTSKPATSTATTSTPSTSRAAKTTTTSTAATSTATTSTATTSTATTSTAAKTTTTTSTPSTSTAAKTTTTTSTSATSTATTSTSTTTELKISSTTLAPTSTSLSSASVVPAEEENNGRPNAQNAQNAQNANQSNRRRVAREVNGQKTLTASCSQKTAIRNTNCSVTLSVDQRVSPCCILRTLCEASKESSDFNAVGRRVDIINQLEEDCNSDPQEENSCIYTGGDSQSCEESAFTVPQSNPAQCNTEETCGCSSYCSGSNAYYAFEISVQDREISFERVSSLISKLGEAPECSTNTDASCPSPNIAAQYKGFSLSCGSTTTNLGNCRVVLNFTDVSEICEVAEAVVYVLQAQEQITFTRQLTSAAICGNSDVSLQQTELTWRQFSSNPVDFCPALEGTSGFKCESGETLLILLDQQCDLKSTTVAPNVTTIQPNTTLSVNVTTTPQNTTLNVTVLLNTTTANVTVPLNTTTANTTVPVNATTTTPNAEAQANALLEMTKDVSKLNSSQISQLVSQLERLLSGPNVSLALGNTSVQIVSNLLGASPEVLSDSSTRIIGLVDTVGLKLVLEEAEETLLSSDVALSVKPADGTNFQETIFSILSPDDVQLRGGSRRSRSVRADSSIPQGSIRLPPSLTQNLSAEQQQQASRVQFNFYQKSTVFQDISLGQRRLISGILGASVANLSISNLQDDVVINLRNTEPIPANFVATCVFWDFALNDGSGGWNPNGCSVQNSTDNETVCACNHLTSFAILLDLSRTPLTSRVQATILTFITYIGCGISAIFLAITLLTYLAFGKLRKDIPSKILIQLCLALLLLNLVFLVDAWLALYPDAVGLCISTAWFLHYFLLVSFTWMGLEAVHMYLALVKVFNSYISRYMLKFSLVGWGVPMIVVIIVIAIDKDNYGLVTYGRFTDGTSDDFCWIKNDIAFYVAVVAYFCVIFLFNLVMFVVVLVQLCRIKRQNPHNSSHRTTMQDVRSVVGITLLLGLTWGFAFFAWGPVNLAFMYLFAIFNSLHGFFIFVFHCAVKENVRRQWRTYLCCGRMRLAENSDWSRTATQKTMKKSSVTRLTPERSSKQSNNSSSSSFLVTDSTEHLNGINGPFEDRAITADEEPGRDVIFNEFNRQRRSHQAS